jgi:UDP-N-acetylglucosamine 2-epimerase (non-hydrolysing)
MKIEKILIVLGTRPEAIKMAPVVAALRDSPAFVVKVCVTAQHREMLDQTLASFGIEPEFDLNVMEPDQHLSGLTARLVRCLGDLYLQWRPELVMVQGDTTTTFSASLSAFYEKIPVAHIEAGLRTRRMYSPWPEEINRHLTSVLATWHFAPTEEARRNLLDEGIDPESITVTGNTVIDSLRQTVSRFTCDPSLKAFYEEQFSFLRPGRRLVLVTGHRRENIGEALKQICSALQQLARRGDIDILYPVHLNPNVRRPVEERLGKTEYVHLVEPQAYVAFAYLLQRCHMILTDSGGIQEEASFLGKPVLLMRDVTERPEAARAGVVKLVGTDVRSIVQHATQLLDDCGAYRTMAQPTNLLGDGYASHRITKHLESLQEAGIAGRSSFQCGSVVPPKKAVFIG